MSKEREALKLTLAALKQIDEAMPFPVAKLAIMKAEEVLEQPEQEPVAYLYHDAKTPKEAHPWLHSTMLVLAADRRKGLRGETPLYDTPPQRTWVGLTPQERDEINQKVFGIVPHYVAFHHAIEAKLKEKNT